MRLRMPLSLRVYLGYMPPYPKVYLGYMPPYPKVYPGVSYLSLRYTRVLVTSLLR